MTNPLGEVWTYGCGGLVAETDFSGRALAYRNDVSGRLIERVNAAGQRTTHSYNQVGDLVEQRDCDGSVTSYAYDRAGRLLRTETGGTLVEYTRDPLGRVLTESVDGRVLRNEYDLLGRRVRRTTPSGAATEWTYTALGLPETLATDGGAIIFQYDASGRETTRFLGPGAALTQVWDTDQRLTGQAIWALDAAPADPDAAAVAAAPTYRQLQDRTYSYRADGYPLRVGDTLRGAHSHELDALGRVTSVTAATWSERYTYDGLGNVIDASHPQSTAQAGGNADRREFAGAALRRDSRTTYDYDPQGRLVRKVRRTLSGQTLTWVYSWDAEDRLTQLTTPQSATWQYRYDALGRRIAKQRIAPDGEVAEEVLFTWDDTRLSEQAQAGPDGQTLVTTWEWDGESHWPVSQLRRRFAADAPQLEIDRAFHAIVTDLVGTPLELVTPDGRIAWCPTSTLWGVPLGDETGAAGCPLRFPGQYFDAESGLHYNFRRYYDPHTGGYLSADPIGLIPGPNPYAYVVNPLLWSDPLGLAGAECEVTVYHYTTKDGYNSIKSGNPYQIKPGDSKNGPGPFFTNLSPDDLTEPGAFKRKLGVTNEKSQYVVEFKVPKSQLVPLRGGRGAHVFSIPGGVSIPRPKVRYIGPTSGWSAG